MNDFIQDLVAGQVYFDEKRQRPELPWWAAGIELVTPGDQFSGAKKQGRTEQLNRQYENLFTTNPEYARLKQEADKYRDLHGPKAAIGHLAELAHKQRMADAVELQTLQRGPEMEMFDKQLGLKGDLAKLDMDRHTATLLQQSQMAENNLANQLALANVNADVARYGVDARNRMALEKDANEKRMMMVMLGLQGLDGLINAFT